MLWGHLNKREKKKSDMYSTGKNVFHSVDMAHYLLWWLLVSCHCEEGHCKVLHVYSLRSYEPDSSERSNGPPSRGSNVITIPGILCERHLLGLASVFTRLRVTHTKLYSASLYMFVKSKDSVPRKAVKRGNLLIPLFCQKDGEGPACVKSVVSEWLERNSCMRWLCQARHVNELPCNSAHSVGHKTGCSCIRSVVI